MRQAWVLGDLSDIFDFKKAPEEMEYFSFDFTVKTRVLLREYF